MNIPPLYFPPINAIGNFAFRHTCIKAGADFVFSEMVRISKLIEGVEYQYKKLKTLEEDRDKTFIQIISDDLTNITTGVDIVMKECPWVKEINYNMGCPRSSRASLEWGAGILKYPEKVYAVAIELYQACKKYNVRASIKMRLGVKEVNVHENVKLIKEAGINKVYIHGRTLKDSYNAPARYEEIAEVKKEHPDMQIIANGDVVDYESLQKIITQTNCDGILIGRAAIKDPYIFQKCLKKGYKATKNGDEFNSRVPVIKEFITCAKKGNLSYEKIKSNIVNMSRDVTNGTEFRQKLNTCKSEIEIEELLEEY